MKALPQQIKIGPVTFDVKEESRTATDGKYGAILYADSTISLMPGLSLAHAEITLWHEIVHFIFTKAGISDQDEQLPVLLSYGIVEVIRDNPGLVK